jgi:hypothetical protein
MESNEYGGGVNPELMARLGCALVAAGGPPPLARATRVECPMLFVVEDDERESADTYCELMSRFGVVRVAVPVSVLPLALLWARGG